MTDPVHHLRSQAAFTLTGGEAGQGNPSFYPIGREESQWNKRTGNKSKTYIIGHEKGYVGNQYHSGIK